jgi:putative endonuclease
MVYVYVLYSESFKKHYVGMTENLQNRLKEHNQGKSTFTKAYVPWKIIYVESTQNFKEGRLREIYLKSTAGKKFVKKQLVNGITGSLSA